MIDGDDPYSGLADRFVEHYQSLRGAVRLRLIAEQFDEFLPDESGLQVVDVGGGAGHQAYRLAANGHHVTLIDPSSRMLQHARRRLDDLDTKARQRVTIVQATAADAVDVFDGRRFDLVCCHAVLPYIDDARRLIGAVVALARPGAIVSVVFKNRDALAMRPALEDRWRDAEQAFDAHADVGGLGAATRAHRLDDITRLLADAGAPRRGWFGIRVFTDHLGQRPPGERFDDILAVERRAARTDPYRSVARLLHVIAQRRDT